MMNGFSLHLKRVWRGRVALWLLMLLALSPATFRALGATESALNPAPAKRQASSQRPLVAKRGVSRTGATGQTRRATPATVALASPAPVLRRAVEGYTPLTGISLVFNNNSLYQPGQVAIATIMLSGSGADARPVTLRSDPADRVSIRPEDATFQLAPGTPHEVRVTMPATPGVYAFVASSSRLEERKEVEVAVRTWDVGAPIRPGTISVTSGAATGGGTPRPTATPTPTPAPATGTTTGGTTPTGTTGTGGTTTPTPRPTATPTPVPNIVAVTPGEVVTLTVEGAADGDHYQPSRGTGIENDTLTYAWSGSNIAAGAASPTPSITVTAPQSGRASFTCTINDTPLARGSALGTRDDTTPVTARVTLVVNTGTGTGTGGTGVGTPPTPFEIGGDSNVSLRLVRPGQEEIQGQGLSGNVGGSVVVQIIIEVAPKGRVRGDLESVMVRLKEDAEDVDHPFEQNHADVAFGFTQSDWVVWRSSDTSPTPTRLPGTGSAKTANTSADTTYFYVKSFTWNTAAVLSGTSANPVGAGARVSSTLLGHNAEHALSMVEVNDVAATEFPFEKQAPTGGAWEAAPYSVQETTLNVKNLVITEVSTNNGTVDYFKFSPNSESEELYSPKIKFDIEDENPAPTYKWTIWFKGTKDVHATSEDANDWRNGASKIEGVVSSTGTRTTVNVDLLNAGADSLDPRVAEAGTYSFDVLVEKIDGSSVIDKQQFKQPYLSWIPRHYLDRNARRRKGHEAWVKEIDVDTEEEIPFRNEIRANYYVQSVARSEGLAQVSMVVVDSSLSEKATVTGGGAKGVLHGGAEGFLVYEQRPDDLFGDWRVVFCAEDIEAQAERRAHDVGHMIAVNQKFDFVGYAPLNFNRLSRIYASARAHPPGILNPTLREKAFDIGNEFEKTALSAFSWAPNTVHYPRGSTFPPDWPDHGTVKPDVVLDVTILFRPTPFKESHFVEVKSSDSFNAESYNHQIWKEIRALADSPASPRNSGAFPMLTLITPSRTRVGADIARTARRFFVYASRIRAYEEVRSVSYNDSVIVGRVGKGRLMFNDPKPLPNSGTPLLVPQSNKPKSSFLGHLRVPYTISLAQ